MPSVDILQQCNGACRALLVKEPWASQLVTGKKTMELRSTRCSFRENVAIARIGTSQIIGTCRIVDCKLVATRDLSTGNLVKAPECPSDFQVKFQLKWHEMKDMMQNYNMIWAWIMEDPVRFECPLQFKRPKGAQVWFRLDRNGNETTSRSNSKNQKKPKRSQSPHLKIQKQRRPKSGWGKGAPPSLLLMLIIGTLGEASGQLMPQHWGDGRPSTKDDHHVSCAAMAWGVMVVLAGRSSHFQCRRPNTKTCRQNGACFIALNLDRSCQTSHLTIILHYVIESLQEEMDHQWNMIMLRTILQKRVVWYYFITTGIIQRCGGRQHVFVPTGQ